MENLSIVQSPQQQIDKLEDEIRERKKQLAQVRKKIKPKEVADATFVDMNGKEVLLSSLFGDKEELLLIFNMGKSCRWCTLWADGFNGLSNPLASRAGFALVSPDKPEVAKEFSESRNWKFHVLSDFKNTLRKDLGLRDEKSITPAAATFSKDENGKIWFRSSAVFGPGDNYCVQYDLMDLLPESSEKWEPQYNY
ncbi:MAG: DUF899 family protein [Chitinophagales bacterium]|nr:DUF899 family protein [Chitinophagales bacterium]